MIRRIIFRVDGNSKIGLGHLYRAIALAHILERTLDSYFLVNHDSIIAPLLKAKFSFQYIPENITLESEPDWISRTFSECDTIVLDGYQFNESYQSKFKLLNKRLIYIDDLAKGTQKADVVINHSPNIKKTDYIKEDYTKLALGLKYAVLRPSFIQAIHNIKQIGNEIETVFISFGGADPNDFTYQTVINILQIESIKTINVIVGAAYEHKRITEIKNERVILYKNQSEKEIYNLMNNSDLAITPASTTSLELASLKVPMILGFFVENQISIYNGFVENNAVFDVGDFRKYDFSKLKDLIATINVSRKLNEKVKVLSTMFESYDRNDIIDLFVRDNTSLRFARKSDIKFIFDLSNEAEVRQNSFNSAPILLDEHKKWFKDILKRKSLYYIIENSKNPIGQIRFMEKEHFSVIGISISNKFRGRGFAKKGLAMAVKEYFSENNKPILAYIKKTNRPSINAFKKVGFSFYKEELFDDIKSDVYIKRK